MHHLKEIYQNFRQAFYGYKRPVSRGIYAIEKGDSIGEFIVFIRQNKAAYYEFLSLPKMTPKNIAPELFTEWLKTNTLKFVERLPILVFKVCNAQYNKNMLNIQNQH